MANPLLYDVLKITAAISIRRSGYSRSDTQSVIDSIPNEVIDQVAVDAGVTIPAFTPIPPTAKQAPSGQLLALILAFLATPGGQALEAALLQLLIGLIPG